MISSIDSQDVASIGFERAPVPETFPESFDLEALQELRTFYRSKQVPETEVGRRFYGLPAMPLMGCAGALMVLWAVSDFFPKSSLASIVLVLLLSLILLVASSANDDSFRAIQKEYDDSLSMKTLDDLYNAELALAASHGRTETQAQEQAMKRTLTRMQNHYHDHFVQRPPRLIIDIVKLVTIASIGVVLCHLLSTTGSDLERQLSETRFERPAPAIAPTEVVAHR